ncbi:E3 ubiquitin-protein ligase RZF1-like isoform X2 [Stegodyphus dumicola]|uniref:E3 ubiquitin-protein ligase RZF1-like isoform X2 n=1 Tax=Stegodyphus dumicola TaxID=202533 RepID=UPI0015B06E61|nr:E3 ubiquitin-protein ligase RZF1-like isoform X2 [Stegodyphus dumicola]
MAEGIELASMSSRYFCHGCSREVTVSPIHTTELTCPECSGEFLEEMSRDLFDADEEYVSDVDEEDLALINGLRFGSWIRRTFSNVADDLSESYEPEPEQRESLENRALREALLDDDPADSQFLRLRYLGDYLFGDDIDALATQLLNEAEISGPPPLPQEQIKQLPIITVTKEHVDKGVQCTVCMNDFHPREKAKCLPCEHFYHEKCITPWLERHRTCPNCRKVVDMQSSRSRRSRSCPRTTANSGSSNAESRRFSGSTHLTDFVRTSGII